MVDIATIGAALTSIKIATEIAKALKNSGVTLEKAEQKLQLAELICALADVKVEVAGMQNLVLEKDEQITKLKKKLNKEINVEYEEPYYWVVEDGQKGGPFCQVCYDKGDKFIRINIPKKDMARCKVCKHYFSIQNVTNGIMARRQVATYDID